MKRIFISLVLILLIMPESMLCARKSRCDIKVMTFNIRTENKRDGDNSWANRRSSVVSLINDVSPDFFGIQEAKIGPLKYMEQFLPNYTRIGVGRDDGASAGEHEAIFFKTERFELLDSGNFWVSQTPAVPSKSWDARHYRIATWVKLKDRISGESILYMNTHLDLTPMAKAEGVKILVRKIGELREEGMAVVLSGDFNLQYEEESMRPFDGVLLNSRTVFKSENTQVTYNGFGRPGAGKIIDHLLCSGLYPVSYHVNTDGYGVPFISDHYPVVVVYSFSRPRHPKRLYADAPSCFRVCEL